MAHLIAASGYECEQGSEQIMSSLPVHIDVIVADDLLVHEQWSHYPSSEKIRVRVTGTPSVP